MPRKKAISKSTRKSSPLSTKPPLASSFNRLFLAILLPVLVVAAIGTITYFLVPRIRPTVSVPARAPIPAVSVPTNTPVKPEPKPRTIVPPFEVFPKDQPPETTPTARTPQSPPVQPPPPPPPPRRPEPPIDKRPKVAIIIDDMGYDRRMTRLFLQLDAVITYAILPFSPLQEEIQQTANQRGLDTLLHLPMEPLEYPTITPGEGALLTTMSPDALITQLKKDILAVPAAKGVNNHMGSKMTEVSEQMNQIFSVLKKEGLFFIDSRTTPASLCRSSAHLFRIPFAERNVFLDHVQKTETIRGQIEQLIQAATEKGEAVGIGHPHQVTYEILEQMLPEIKKKVRLVPASEVVHLQG